MPLVTRQSNLGTLIVEATEPANPNDGDVWTDLGQNPPIVKVNDAGTFRPMMQAGTFVQGDTVFANANNTLDRLAKGTDGQFLKIGASIPVWANNVINLERLDAHTAGDTESTYTFTPATALDEDDFSAVNVYFCGETSASLALQIKINALATAYFTTGSAWDISGVITAVDINNASEGEIASTTIIDQARQVNAILEIMLEDPAGVDEHVLMFSKCNSSSQLQQRNYIARETAGLTDISSIETKTSTSTWKAGTKIDTFGIKRT